MRLRRTRARVTASSRSSSRRLQGKGLQMEGQVVLDRGVGLDGFDRESSADVADARSGVWERLRMVLLPEGVLGAEVKGA